jgi:hypothetical protein
MVYTISTDNDITDVNIVITIDISYISMVDVIIYTDNIG